MYELWCEVILRDVRSAILTKHQNKCIYFHIKPITFLLRTHYNQKKLNYIYYMMLIKNVNNCILIKQTKNDKKNQNKSKSIVATSVSRAVMYYES